MGSGIKICSNFRIRDQNLRSKCGIRWEKIYLVTTLRCNQPCTLCVNKTKLKIVQNIGCFCVLQQVNPNPNNPKTAFFKKKIHPGAGPDPDALQANLFTYFTCISLISTTFRKRPPPVSGHFLSYIPWPILFHKRWFFFKKIETEHCFELSM